jgi:hypothetical protein
MKSLHIANAKATVRAGAQQRPRYPVTPNKQRRNPEISRARATGECAICNFEIAFEIVVMNRDQAGRNARYSFSEFGPMSTQIV